jgi:hypothetical protein
MDHFSARDISAPVEKHTDWERFRSLTSEIISPRIQIDTLEGAVKPACNSQSLLPLHIAIDKPDHTSGTKNELPGLDPLLQHKQRQRKLQHETRDAACETVTDWITKTIRRMMWNKAFERRERNK